MQRPTEKSQGIDVSVLRPSASSPMVDEPGSLSAPFAKFAAELAGEVPHSAPIIMPDGIQLAVRMVRADVLSQLDEARGEANLHQSLTLTVGGAVLGTLAATLVLTPEGYAVNQILLGASGGLAVSVVGFGLFWYRAARKAHEIRKKLLGP